MNFIVRSFTFKEFEKFILIVGFFFILPIFNFAIPKINIGFMTFTLRRIIEIGFLLYLVCLLSIGKVNIRISKHAIYMLLYAFYVCINSFANGYLEKNIIANAIIPVMFLISFESISYTKSDLEKFLSVMYFLGGIIFIVSILQAYIDHNIYAGFHEQRTHLVYKDIFRNSSIFNSFGLNEAGVAMGMLSILFLFENFKRNKVLPLFFFSLISFSIYLTYTRTNWSITIIGLLTYALIQFFNKKLKQFFFIGAILSVIFLTYFQFVYDTPIHKKRVTSDTYLGRIESAKVFFKYFIDKKILFGNGRDSFSSELFFKYKRPEAHIGYVEILFKDGIFGGFLYAMIWLNIYRVAISVYRETGNPCFIAFIIAVLAINLTYAYIKIDYLGYFIMLFYMQLHSQLYNIKTYRKGIVLKM